MTTRRRVRGAWVALSLVGLGCGPATAAEDPTQAAAGFKKLFMHDECTGQYPPQPDTCAHERRHEKSFVFYKEDFEATVVVAAGATVVVRVVDGNDRQIDNGKPGPDRQQTIAGVVDDPRPGQMLSLDVLRVKAR
jgi:hypothetical protein